MTDYETEKTALHEVDIASKYNLNGQLTVRKLQFLIDLATGESIDYEFWTNQPKNVFANYNVTTHAITFNSPYIFYR